MQFTKEKHPCGGCHAWGANPNITNGKCSCGKTEKEIKKHAGKVILSGDELKEAVLFNAPDREKFNSIMKCTNCGMEAYLLHEEHGRECQYCNQGNFEIVSQTT